MTTCCIFKLSHNLPSVAIYSQDMLQDMLHAGLAQLSDTFVSDPQSVFSVGQSVRARLVEVCSVPESSRPSVHASPAKQRTILRNYCCN